jgi:hypothetical protein
MLTLCLCAIAVCACRAKWKRASSHSWPPTPPGNPLQPAGRSLTPLALSAQQQVQCPAPAQGLPATRPQQGSAAAPYQGLATLQQQGSARVLGPVLAWARVCRKLEGTRSCGSSHPAAAAMEQQQASARLFIVHARMPVLGRVLQPQVVPAVSGWVCQMPLQACATPTCAHSSSSRSGEHTACTSSRQYCLRREPCKCQGLSSWAGSQTSSSSSSRSRVCVQGWVG